MIQTQRTKILDAWVDRLEKLYGPTGSTEKIFRFIRRGAWRPGNPIRPGLTIIDDGQEITFNELDDEKNDDGQTGSSDATLKIKIVLDLAENWDREQPNRDWSNIVQDVARRFGNWCPAGFGIMNTRYMGDDFFDFLAGEGKSEQLWMLEFEVDYFFESGIHE